MARKKHSSNYFTEETEKYINLYNQSTDQDYRNKIFTEHIYLPFYKLCENIIHTFKFYYTDVEKIEDLKHELVSILLEDKIMKFDPGNGGKAFSYFGTIVKRWLINYNNTNYKKLKKIGSFTDIEEYYEDTSNIESPSAKTLGVFIDTWADGIYEDLDTMFQKKEDRKVADAVLTLFKKRANIEIFRKKALYIYIREMTDCETPHLTRVINVLKEDFYELYQKHYDLGLL